MYTKLIASSLLATAFVAMPCLANPVTDGEVGYIPPFPSGPSTLTREQVVSELMASLHPAESTPDPSTLTRAEVIAELMRAQRDGTMPPNGEGADTGVMAERRLDPTDMRPTLAAR